MATEPSNDKERKHFDKGKDPKEDSDMEEADAAQPKLDGKKDYPTKKDTYVCFLGTQSAKV